MRANASDNLDFAPQRRIQLGRSQNPERQLVPLHPVRHLDALGFLLPEAFLDDQEGMGGEGDQAIHERRAPSASLLASPGRILRAVTTTAVVAWLALSVAVLDACWQIFTRLRRARVWVHQAYFVGNPEEAYYFVTVSNLSISRDIRITHVWFAADPPVQVLARRPARLPPTEEWTTYISASSVNHIPEVERSARVRLTGGKVVRSKPSSGLPDVGYLPGEEPTTLTGGGP
jgi:hypothetical protein